MFVEFLTALLGCVVGCVCGLLPGFHTNLVAVLIVGLNVDLWLSCVFLVSVAVSRSVVDAVSCVFLGFSEDVLALLPGHKLLKRGCGIEAVKFCVLGSVLGVIVGVLLIPFFIFIFPILFSLIRPFLFWLLLLLVFILLFRDLWWSFVIFLLSGLVGVLALNSLRDPLFPLLSGLFGASGLLFSLFSKSSIPLQVDTDVFKLKSSNLFSSVFLGVLSAGVVILFPGLGPSQAAALVQSNHSKPFPFLVLVGVLGTVDVVFSLVVLFVLGKARNGAVVVIDQLLGSISFSTFLFFVAVACFSVGLSAFFAVFASKWYALFIELVDYSVVSFCVLLFLLCMCFVLSGWLGVLVFLVSCSIGVIAQLANVSRSHAMGCLLLPTLFLLW